SEANTGGRLIWSCCQTTRPSPYITRKRFLHTHVNISTSNDSYTMTHSSMLLTEFVVFAKHSIVQALRTGSGIRDGLVKELDPDAMNRGDG
ncbi:hypothetical protein DEU56DRAFT_829403, partial [Suillus clintonianus]|uniref:uncharacterized protein n=1 Tax=Suillus clintonianus TaxID=1904413 RepID=UPI001B87A364